LSAEKETPEDLDLSPQEDSDVPTPNHVSTPTPPPSPSFQIKESKAKPVIHYIVIMFAVALSLIVLSFLMQQRNHNALMKGISASTVNTQTIMDLELKIKTIEDELTKASEQLNTMTADNKKLQETNDALVRKAQAMEWLMELRQNYSNGKHSKARELAKKMQENGLIEALPTESALPDTPSPRAIYDEILSELS
jgi:uncharacterized protein HemX